MKGLETKAPVTSWQISFLGVLVATHRPLLLKVAIIEFNQIEVDKGQHFPPLDYRLEPDIWYFKIS